MVKFLLILCILIPISGAQATVDFEDRKRNIIFCLKFAIYAHSAAAHLNKGYTLKGMNFEIESSGLPDLTKDILLQSVQFVDERKITNPKAAYDIALGSCIKRRDSVKNILIPWTPYYRYMQMEV